MIRCDHCGTDNLDGSEYCDECGMKLEYAPAVRSGFVAPAYVPPQSNSAAASRNGEPSPIPLDHIDQAQGSPNGAIPSPPAFTTSTSIPRPARPVVRDQRRSQPPPSVVQTPEPASPGQTLVLSSRGRTDALRSEPPAPNGGAPRALSKLVIERGGRVGKEFSITGAETHIGRWDADSGIFPDVDLDQDDPEAKVSRRHARIMNQNGQYFIEDLGSTNGTFVNRGRRLLPGHRQMLRSGDEIIVGKTFLKFHIIS